jgi:tetratricopeptide (TPR) repeat protein
MGEVYEAYDPRLRRQVAIKVLPAAFAEDPGRLLRLEREARATAALNHPNILAVHDIGTHDAVRYIVMERVPGETLAARLKRDRPSLGLTLDVGVQIADALEAVHARGILHRDLKPANVMLTPEGRVKVLDFGLAREWTTDTAMTGLETTAGVVTHAGQIIGTPAYMAPEQLRGLQGGPRADIYSLGVMMFELATGQRPFQAQDFVGAALDKLTRDAPLPSDINPSVPAALSDLIARCLARDPERRPGSAAEVRSGLERIRTALPSAAAGVSPPQPDGFATWGPPSGGPGALMRRATSVTMAQIGLLSAVAIAATAVTLGVDRWRSTPPAPTGARPVIAVMPLQNLTGDSANDYVSAGIADALTTSLSGLRSISVVSREIVRESERTATDPAAIARELGLDLLVHGSLQRSGDRLRVDARLMAAGGTVLWAGESEAMVSDLYALQRELADRLVSALRIQVSASERTQLVAPPTQNQDALEAYWRGVAALDRYDPEGFDRAIESFDRAVDLDPAFAVAYAGLGAAFVGRYIAVKDTDAMARATAAVRRALEIDPSRSEVRLSLANIYRRTGRFASAVEELQRVLASDAANDEARRRLGLIYDSEGRPEEALEQLRAAVGNRPSYWRNHDALGLFYLRAGRTEEALEAFTRVAELRPDSATAFQRLGTTYLAQGDTARAREYLEKSNAIQPDAASYSNLGTIHYSEERYGEAATAYRAAIQLRPNRALLRRNLGDAYLKLGRPRDARSEYESAARLVEEELRVNPSNPRVMAQLAVYQAKLGLRGDAERRINQAIVMTPMDPEVLFRRAAVLALLGEIQRAMDAVSSAVANGYSVDLVKQDDDLSPLRGLPAFQALVSPK